MEMGLRRLNVNLSLNFKVAAQSRAQKKPLIHGIGGINFKLEHH